MRFLALQIENMSHKRARQTWQTCTLNFLPIRKQFLDSLVCRIKAYRPICLFVLDIRAVGQGILLLFLEYFTHNFASN